jgi:hypothetical protein
MLHPRVRTMAMLQSRRSRRRQWLALWVLAALVAQFELPAAHAVETADPVGDPHAAASDVQLCAAHPEPAHDPAGCFVCRGLLRAHHAAAAPACSEPRRSDPDALLAAPELRPRAAPARSGHPPRAPPAP